MASMRPATVNGGDAPLRSARATAFADCGFYTPWTPAAMSQTFSRAPTAVLSPPPSRAMSKKRRRLPPIIARLHSTGTDSGMPQPGPGTYSPVMQRHGAPCEVAGATLSKSNSAPSLAWRRNADGRLVPPPSRSQLDAGRPIYFGGEPKLLIFTERQARAHSIADSAYQEMRTNSPHGYDGSPSRYPERVPSNAEIALWWHLERGDLRLRHLQRRK